MIKAHHPKINHSRASKIWTIIEKVKQIIKLISSFLLFVFYLLQFNYNSHNALGAPARKYDISIKSESELWAMLWARFKCIYSVYLSTFRQICTMKSRTGLAVCSPSLQQSAICWLTTFDTKENIETWSLIGQI